MKLIVNPVPFCHIEVRVLQSSYWCSLVIVPKSFINAFIFINHLSKAVFLVIKKLSCVWIRSKMITIDPLVLSILIGLHTFAVNNFTFLNNQFGVITFKSFFNCVPFSLCHTFCCQLSPCKLTYLAINRWICSSFHTTTPCTYITHFYSVENYLCLKRYYFFFNCNDELDTFILSLE